MIGDLHVPCPTLSEQSTIATILGTLDDKIELNRRMNETLEAIARAIFKSWFVDFDPVRAKAEGGQPAITSSVSRLFPRRFVLGVPEGWSYQELQTWCDSIDNGGTPKRMVSQYWDNGAIPWFKTGELKDCPLIDSEEHISEIGLRESACSLWPIGTILVALYASPTVGRLGILAVPGAANQACSALQISSAYGNHFAFHSLLSIRDELQRVAVGAAQQNISQQVLRKHRVLSPTKEIAKGFSDLVDPLWQKQTQNLRESGTLASLRDVLLPKLLSGEIRVKEAEKAVEAVV
jgi:type I restriction enzyme S subunit